MFRRVAFGATCALLGFCVGAGCYSLSHIRVDPVITIGQLFQSILTMLDPGVQLGLVMPPHVGVQVSDGQDLLHLAEERSKQLGRDIAILAITGETGPEIVRLARENAYDLLVLAPPDDSPSGGPLPLVPWMEFVLRNAHCRVFVAAMVALPQEAAE